MYTANAAEISKVQNTITMYEAMRASSLQRGAASAVAAADEILHDAYKRMMELSYQPVSSRDVEMREHRVSCVERILEALDPDQNEFVNWWVC